jgi:rhamnose utilization protein RhaD (predicted bifunctional aldolase and dehydrogenase)
MDPVQRLIYRSNILGADARITNTGGGNTSSKLDVKDPLTGETTRVLWVKGSGGDLRTATKANFASLYLDQVLNLRTLYEKYEQRGRRRRPKTRWSACIRTPRSIATRLRRASTRRCTPSSRMRTSTTCIRWLSSRSRRRRTALR